LGATVIDVVCFTGSLWWSVATNLSHSWIPIDFRHYRINSTHYSIRTQTDDDHYHPRSWC
jgi:hypothetical protein